MWDNQIRKAAGLKIQENSEVEIRPFFCRDKREDDIYV